MRTAAHDAKVMKTVAAIRGLQTQAAGLACVRADLEQRAADARLEEGRAAVRLAEQGWAAVIGAGRLDPALSRAWLHALQERQAEAQALGETAAAAAEAAQTRRGALHAAQARSEAPLEQARNAARAVSRRYDEARLAAVEDQLNARWRRA